MASPIYYKTSKQCFPAFFSFNFNLYNTAHIKIHCIFAFFHILDVILE